MTKRMPKVSPVVLTIGHSTRTLEGFLGLLRAHAARWVVDVRSVPRSRHSPQFNRDTLPAALRDSRIRYAHMPGSGGLRHAPADSRNTARRNAPLPGFTDSMQAS